MKVCNLEIDVNACPLTLKLGSPYLWSVAPFASRKGSRGCSCTELWRASRECCTTVDDQSASFQVVIAVQWVKAKHENSAVFFFFCVCFTTWARLVFSESFLTTALMTYSLATFTFSVSLPPTVETMNILVRVLIRFLSWAF